MNCLVIAATPLEIAPLLHTYSAFQLPKDVEVAFGITGVGLTATTYWLTKKIARRRPDLIIQAGIGGCFDATIPLGSVVFVEQDTIADQGVMEDGELRSLFELGLVSENEPPYQEAWLKNTNHGLVPREMRRVTGITTNEITTAQGRIDTFKAKYNPHVESLEGAALHYIGRMENIEFVQIRSLSNYIGERDKTKWRMKESIANLNKALDEMLSSL